MKIQIKDLINMLPDMNPESYICVGGGHADYSTTDVEVIEQDGMVMFQESSRVRPERYDIVNLPDDVSQEYCKLVIFKSYMSTLSEVMALFDAAFMRGSGVIIIDTMFSTGNNSNRFVKVVVTDGKLDPKSFETVTTSRHDAIRVFSNKHIAKDPDSLQASVLTQAQMKLLLKGISI